MKGSVKTFVIPFYYGPGSGYAEAKSYESYGSGSATLIVGTCKVPGTTLSGSGSVSVQAKSLDLNYK
jgi:hypothetical protein